MTDKIDHNPGPGQYNTENNFYSEHGNSKNKIISIKYTISKSKRNINNSSNFINKESSQVPGPGHYNTLSLDLSNTNNRGKSPSYKIGKASRDTNIKSETPGPGNYHDNLLNTSTSVRAKSPSYT
jgi:hypothetical protein